MAHGGEDPPITVYVYHAPLHTATGTWPVVAKAARDAVERLIPLSEFPALFSGYVLWAPPSSDPDARSQRAIGVWGRRNAAMFRRILRERGASVRIEYGSGPDHPVAAVCQSSSLE